MVPLISYLSATMAPGTSVGVNEYSCPHVGQKPSSRFSLLPQPSLLQSLRWSGTMPDTSVASGSMGASAGLARGLLPSTRGPVRPVRCDPDRVERVERLLRVEGTRPEPVRDEPGVVRALWPGWAAWATAGGAMVGAMPHRSQ
jgi:hypothetical protein